MEPSSPRRPTPTRLEGNTPLSLDGTQAWLVTSGAVALFRVGGSPQPGPEGRRFLVGIETGGAILWQPGPGGPTVVVVAIEPAVLAPRPMADVLATIATGNAAEIARMHTWVKTLSADLVPAGVELLSPPDGTATASAVAASLSVVQEQFLRAADQIDRARPSAA